MRFLKALPWIGSLLFHALIVVLPMQGLVSGSLFPPGKSFDFSLEQSSPGTAPTAPADSAPAVSAPVPKDAVRAASVPAAVSTSADINIRAEPSDPLEGMLEPDAGRDSPASTLGSPELGVSAEIDWESTTRSQPMGKLPPFPKILSAEGQEVFCEARITVSALGTVTNVEIVKSSGYIEIDASVKSALYGYVFPRNYDSGTSSVGIVKFRFRLERLD
jgi:outer membrane biosynthesis protein TonB